MIDASDAAATLPSSAVIRQATGGARATTSSREAVEHRIENMTTSRLERFSGSRTDGTGWSVIAKSLQPASRHPSFAEIPPEHRQQVLEDLDWTDEPRLYRSGLGEQLPHPLRMPSIFAIDEALDQATIWMEDLADTGTWDLPRYQRTANVLGRLGAAWRPDVAIARFGLDRRDISRLFFGKVRHLDLVVQSDDAFWTMPMIADAVDRRHRRDLFELADRMPTMLQRLRGVHEGVCHGDASPDNFREPGDGSIVAIDWAYGHVGPIGSDLGQLLVGRVESGDAAPDALESIAATIVAAYVDGAEEGGRLVRRDEVERAAATYLAIRSVFSALLVDHRPDLDGEQLAELVRRRAEMARFGMDAALRHGN